MIELRDVSKIYQIGDERVVGFGEETPGVRLGRRTGAVPRLEAGDVQTELAEGLAPRRLEVALRFAQRAVEVEEEIVETVEILYIHDIPSRMCLTAEGKYTLAAVRFQFRAGDFSAGDCTIRPMMVF